MYAATFHCPKKGILGLEGKASKTNWKMQISTFRPTNVTFYSIFRTQAHEEYHNFGNWRALPHRTTSCFDFRLLTVINILILCGRWVHVLVLRNPTETSWRYIYQITPHLIIIWEVSWEKSQKTVIRSGCASLRQSLLSALIYNKTTIIQLKLCPVWSRSLYLYIVFGAHQRRQVEGKWLPLLTDQFKVAVFDDRSWILVANIDDRS